MGKGKGLVTAQGIHRVVVGPLKPTQQYPKGSVQVLEDHLAKWDRRIEKWKPATAWDAANQRSLRYYKRCRAATKKALARWEQREKDTIKRERRRQRLAAMPGATEFGAVNATGSATASA